MLDNDIMWYWFTGALLFGILEVFIEGFVALGLAATCFFFGVLSNFSIIYQNMAAAHFLALAGAIVAGFFVVGNRLFWRTGNTGQVTRLGNTFRDKIVGQVALIKDPIVDGQGSVEANGTVWKCRGLDGPAGTRVLVADIEGNTLLVRRLQDGERRSQREDIAS
jgi:membrane protein implicated in regulation of membrane protease activity